MRDRQTDKNIGDRAECNQETERYEHEPPIYAAVEARSLHSKGIWV